MKRTLIFLLLAMPVQSVLAIHKCVVDGRDVYQKGACQQGAETAMSDVPLSNAGKTSPAELELAVIRKKQRLAEKGQSIVPVTPEANSSARE